MLTRNILIAEHAELVALASQLLEQVRSSEPRVEATATLRWAMTRKLTAHLAKEDSLLYPRLQASTDQAVSARAKQFAHEMGGLGAAYKQYVSDWPVTRMSLEWPAFQQETETIVAALACRVRREESELYSLLTDGG